MDIKIGDRIKISWPNKSYLYEGIYQGRNASDNCLLMQNNGQSITIDTSTAVIDIIKTQNNMNTLEKFNLLFKSEPQKSFRKAGITNGDDLLTDEGQKIFLSYLLKKHGEEFKTEVVDPILAEEKDCKE